MEALLIIIGVICVMWYASKALNHVGDFFNGVSKSLEDYSLSAVKLKHDQEKVTKDLERAVQKLHTIRDLEYEDKIRKEIDELTK